MIHFSKPVKILVVGDLMIDHYLWGKTDRISPEAPVPVVEVKREEKLLGGAGNVVNNLLAFGATVSVASVVGDDTTQDELIAMLVAKGVSTNSIIIEKDRKTSKKTRIIAAHQQVVRVDKESKDPISSSSEAKLAQKIEQELADADLCLISDYGKGVLTNTLTQKIIQLAKKHNKKVLIDPKGIDYSKYKGAYLITPNRKEASEAVGYKLPDLTTVEKAAYELKNSLDLTFAFITLSDEGMLVAGETTIHHKAKAREVFDVTGAGDSVLASLGFALANGIDIEKSAYFANIAAAVVVGKIGSATATLDEIWEYEQKNLVTSTDGKVLSADEAAKKSANLKALGKKVGFTNGCFDLLHRGHIEYLKKSRSFADALFVGVNSDKSVRLLKGASRPVVTEADRAYMLSNLPFVDFVVIFDDETPIDLIKLIKPDVLTKGADYAGKTVVGSDIAKEVVLVDLVDGKSTTNVIKKIKQGEN